MSSHNKGYCYSCGEPVAMDEYAFIGSTKVWLCNAVECAREHARDERDAYEEAREAAMDEVNERFNQGWY